MVPYCVVFGVLLEEAGGGLEGCVGEVFGGDLMLLVLYSILQHRIAHLLSHLLLQSFVCVDLLALFGLCCLRLLK